MSKSNFLSTTKGKVSIAIILIILISGSIYYFMYGSKEAKYTRAVTKILSHIKNSDNESISIYKYIDNGQSSFDKIKSSLESSKKQIDTAYVLSKNTIVPDNYKSTHKNLMQGINSNKLFLVQSIAILNNYSSSTVESSINKLYEHLSSTVGYYEKFAFDNNKITLSKDLLDFPDKIRYYIQYLNKEHSPNKDIKDAHALYINSLKEDIVTLENISTMVQKEIDLAKSSKLSPSQLTITLSRYKSDVSLVINKISNDTPPVDLKELKTSFISFGVAYEDYLSTLKESIVSSSEKDSNKIISSSINISLESLNSYKQKHSSLINLLNEKELTLR